MTGAIHLWAHPGGRFRSEVLRGCTAPHRILHADLRRVLGTRAGRCCRRPGVIRFLADRRVMFNVTERRLGHRSARYIARYTNPPESVAAGYVEDL